MKKFLFILIFVLTFLSSVSAQNVTITLEDLKIFRQAVVEAQFYKNQSELYKEQSAKWEKSASDWQELYKKEKDRADSTLTNAVKECDQSKENLSKANFAFKLQADEDRKKIGELEFDVRKLRSQRKWWFGTGAAVGGAVGGIAGYKAGKKTGFTFSF